MPSSYSFDVTSTIEMPEVDNAVNQARKEIGQRFDFKGSIAGDRFRSEGRHADADRRRQLQARGGVGRAADPADQAQRGGQEPQARRHRAGGRQQRPPGDHAAAGHSHRRRARDRQAPEGSQAQEGAGGDPGRSAAHHLAVEGRSAGRDAGAAREGFRQSRSSLATTANPPSRRRPALRRGRHRLARTGALEARPRQPIRGARADPRRPRHRQRPDRHRSVQARHAGAHRDRHRRRRAGARRPQRSRSCCTNRAATSRRARIRKDARPSTTCSPICPNASSRSAGSISRRADC